MNLTDDLIINNILFNKYNTLSKLCNHAQKLVLLDKVLKSHLTSEMALHCRLGNIKDNFIMIETDRSEYLTQLKFNSLELLSALRKHRAFMHIATIKFKVCPEFNNQLSNYDLTDKFGATENTENNQLSQETIDSFRDAIKDIADDKLKEILIRMMDKNDSTVHPNTKAPSS